MTAAAVGPDKWTDGYQAAADLLGNLPGPMLSVFVPRLLNVTDDPDDDPHFCARFRACLLDALAGAR
ncbi:hypothetical protein [Gordonia sp. ABSL49_1]|uniref:hypothetical protein n=1 Tax=Gordonia sp. ABSL49_1 TaxID=2920941 RepID=UPI001F0DB82D|nr:hypothetical protein [Gordonia sp. ABSL49_1]MCH5644147.1 hypothetical protein [Gordonia sp. ABSL49_1]